MFERKLQNKVLTILSIGLLSGCFSSDLLVSEPTEFDLDFASPTCPGLSSATAAAGPSISLSWGQANDNLTEASDMTYRVFMREGATNYDLNSPTKTIIGNNNTLLTGIQVGRTYTIFVQCLDEKGNKSPLGPENERSVTITDNDAPTAPVLSVSTPGLPNGYTELSLTWTPADDGAQGTTASNMDYNVFFSASPSVDTSGTPLTTITGTTVYTHTGLTPNTTYYYRVVAVDEVGNNSIDSNEVTGVTVADVTAPVFSGGSGIALDSQGLTSIQFSWTAASDNVSAAGDLDYRIYRCSGATTCNPMAGTLVSTTTGTTSYNDTGLTASTSYVYMIRAVDESGNVSALDTEDKLVASTLYDATGSRFVLSPIKEKNQRFGRGVAVGKVYGGDAFDDLVVGAPNDSEANGTYYYTGCVYIFAGDGSGTFSTTPDKRICEPGSTADGGLNNSNYGTAIEIGDLDGDGDDDMVVSHPYREKVYIHLNNGTEVTASAASSIFRNPSNNQFGYGMCLGDITGNGFPDLLIGSSDEDCQDGCGRNDTGRLLVYENLSSTGSYTAFSDTPTTSIDPTSTVRSAPYNWNLSNDESIVQECVVGNFDAANPGRQFVVIGSGEPDTNQADGNEGVLIFYETTVPASMTFAFRDALIGPIGDMALGSSMAAVFKDGPADTVPELFVGAEDDSTGGQFSGAIYGYTVNVSGTGGSTSISLTEQTQRYFGGSDFNYNDFGSGVATGDFNGDGYADLVGGAFADDNTLIAGASNINSGEVYTYLNNGSGQILTTVNQTDFDISAQTVNAHTNFGSCLAKGDFNNDGIAPDIAIGSQLHDYDETATYDAANQGAVFIYYAVATGEIDFDNPSQTIYAPGNQADSQIGVSCLGMDYNADGFDDLIVGAPNRDFTGDSNRGVVFAYFGASNSPLPSAISTSFTTPNAGHSQRIGRSLTSGDFDGNGVMDLAVGADNAPNTTSYRGRVYVYWGVSGTGVQNTSPAPTLIDYVHGESDCVPYSTCSSTNNPYLNSSNSVRGTDGSAYFGWSVQSFKTDRSTAGDDLVVCGRGIHTNGSYFSSSVTGGVSDIGNCFVYRGSWNKNGSQVDYDIDIYPWNEMRFPRSKTSYSANSLHFGSAMTKGDWDGDGNEDLIICSSRMRKMTSPQVNNAGACFAYLGHSSGQGFANGGSSYRQNGCDTGDTCTENTFVPDQVYYNELTDVNIQYWGRSVLLTDINNNASNDLIVGAPVSHNEIDSSGGAGPTTMGKYSGRVHILRGGYTE